MAYRSVVLGVTHNAGVSNHWVVCIKLHQMAQLNLNLQNTRPEHSKRYKLHTLPTPDRCVMLRPANPSVMPVPAPLLLVVPVVPVTPLLPVRPEPTPDPL